MLTERTLGQTDRAVGLAEGCQGASGTWGAERLTRQPVGGLHQGRGPEPGEVVAGRTG